MVYRSGYIPKILGVLLMIDGLGWLVDGLRLFLYPNAHLGFGELIFMVWLLVRGWKIEEPS